MTSTLAVKASASPADVRAFALANGIEVGTRGRLNPAAVAAFNRVSHIKYTEAAHVKTREVTVKVGGRKRTRKFNPAQVRAILRANGVPVGNRGVISAAQFQRAYDLSK